MRKGKLCRSGQDSGCGRAWKMQGEIARNDDDGREVKKPFLNPDPLC